MSILSRLFAAAALFALAACASAELRLYDGQARPAAELAVITLPEQLEVASINGAEVPGAKGMWTRGDKRLQVVPGRYEALVYYREVWQASGDSDVLRSRNPARFTIDAQAGHEYRIDYAHPGTYDDAKKLAQNFQGWVDDRTTGMRIASTDSGVAFKRGVIAQVTGDTTLVSAAPGGDGQGGAVVQPLAIPPPAPTASKAAAAPSAPAQPDAAVAADRDWLGLMKGWWKQASPDERREFLRWLGEQP
jgi:hypothetical protein